MLDPEAGTSGFSSASGKSDSEKIESDSPSGIEKTKTLNNSLDLQSSVSEAAEGAPELFRRFTDALKVTWVSRQQVPFAFDRLLLLMRLWNSCCGVVVIVE